MNLTEGISYDLSLRLDTIRNLGIDINPEATILDFGCGSGSIVAELRKIGFATFGCDIQFGDCDSDETKSLIKSGAIRLLDMDDYVLPFDDSSFDIIMSDQVFEHVQNYSQAIGELARVLKPDGFCLHVFPSRYNLIEAHLYVPFGAICRSYAWLYFWARLGIHNEYQGQADSKDGKTPAEIAAFNHEFLRTKVNYLTKKSIIHEFKKSFDVVEFRETAYLKSSRRGKYMYYLSRVIPFIPAMYSTFRARVLLTKKPRKPVNSASR